MTDEFSDDQDDEQVVLLSRPATAEDLATFTPDMTDDERSALLDRLHATGAEVTFTVTSPHAARDVMQGTSGLFIGPPGSASFLRRPGQADEPPDAMNAERFAVIDEHNKAMMLPDRGGLRSFGSPE